MKSTILETTTTVLTIFSTIGSFVTPALVKNLEGKYNIELMITSLVGIIIFAIYAYGMCQILKNTEDNKDALQRLEKELITPAVHERSTEESKDDKIICPKCGAKQRAERSVCFECGTNFIK